MMATLRLIFESFRFAMEALRANLLRTTLSLLGVTVGIFSIIAVFTLVDSLEKSIRDSMSFLGDRVIYVQKWPWEFKEDFPWWKYFKRPIASVREYKVVEKRVQNGDGVAIFWNKGRNTVKYGNSSVENVNLQGVSFQFNRVSDVRVANGRYFTQQDIDASKPVAILGYEVANGLFPQGNALGKDVKIKGRTFKIIGILEKQGESFLGPSNDSNTIIPYGMFMKMFSTGQRGMEPTLAVKGRADDEGLQELEGELRGLMRNLRGLRPKDEDNFALNRPEMIAGMITSLFSVISVAGAVIGGFSILVGGFGIANIMFVSVKERTNLIGIQKSLGAKNYFILLQFLFESIFLSLIGGGVGILLVLGLTFIPQDKLPILLTPANIILGLGISATIGLLAGMIPATLASRLDPVIAIRAK
jgi:putative ABC transport system permease protein